MSDPRLTPLKVSYGGEIHRIRVNLTEFKFSELKAVFREAFSLEEGSYVIKYADDEGDCVKVTNDEEFAEACRVFLSFASEVQSIRFFAISIPLLKIQEATEPLVKALAALLDSLESIKGKAERQEWAGQCKHGLSITGEAISQAAEDVRDTFLHCKDKISEYQLREKINDAVNEISVATRHLVQNIQASLKSNESTEGSQTAEGAAFVDGTAEAVAEVNEATEIVAEVNEATELSEPAVVVPEIVETSELSEPGVVVATTTPEVVRDEIPTPYASELQIIREIFPHVEAPRVICLLQRYDGNIHITLNALAEM